MGEAPSPTEVIQMTQNTNKTVLITGANSGLGFEAAAQLANLGWSRVILACRTLDKAQAARAQLKERTGVDPFEELEVDVSDNAGVSRAVQTLSERGGQVDFLVLNAGLVSGAETKRSKDGVELTVAASLVGHHILTVGLLNAQRLADDAHIVIAGSEAARGDVAMMKPLPDVAALAAEHTEGDHARAVAMIAKAEEPYVFSNMTHYAITKVFVAHWAAALSRRLPSGIVVNTVSPGSTHSTGAARNLSPVARFMMNTMMRFVGPMMGMSVSVSKATGRYIDALENGADTNGKFYASVPGKMIGDVVEQVQPHILDGDAQEATWNAVVQLSGASLQAVQAAQAQDVAVA